MEKNSESESKKKDIEKEQQKEIEKNIPITAFGVVALAWALANKENTSQYTYEYLQYLFTNYTKDEDRNFFKDILPTLHGVVSKLAYAKENAITSFNRLDDIKKNEYDKLEQITGIGQNIQGNISRIIGIAAGGSIGLLTAPDNLSTIELPAYAILGITIGFTVIEIGLRIYKNRKQKEIDGKYHDRRDSNWDERFTLETHRASVFLYRDVERSLRRHYGLKLKKVRDKTSDWTRMASMVLQKPNSDNSEIANLYKFLELAVKIEAVMREYIAINYKEEFAEYAKTNFEKIANPYKRGLKGLVIFLEKNQLVTKEIYKHVIEIRDKRVALFYDIDGFGIPEAEIWSKEERKNKLIEDAENTLKELEKL